MGFIANLLKGVLGLFISNFPEFILRLVKKIPAKLEKEVQFIIDIVNVIKDLANSELADVLTAAIPGDKDDKLKEWLQMWLPRILNELKLVQAGKIVFSDDEDIRGAQLRAITSVLTEKYTGMPPDQAAITSTVVYRSKDISKMKADKKATPEENK